MKNLFYQFFLWLVLFNVPSISLFGQICDTIEFDYEIALENDSNGTDFSLQSGRVQLNTNLYSYPIIDCDDTGDTVSAFVELKILLHREELSSRYLRIKKEEVFFVALTEQVRGAVKSICFFNYGNLPSKMTEDQRQSLLYQLDPKIAETLKIWEWIYIDEDIESLPLEIDLLIPLHCKLVLSRNDIDAFDPISNIK